MRQAYPLATFVVPVLCRYRDDLLVVRTDNTEYCWGIERKNSSVTLCEITGYGDAAAPDRDCNGRYSEIICWRRSAF